VNNKHKDSEILFLFSYHKLFLASIPRHRKLTSAYITNFVPLPTLTPAQTHTQSRIIINGHLQQQQQQHPLHNTSNHPQLSRNGPHAYIRPNFELKRRYWYVKSSCCLKVCLLTNTLYFPDPTIKLKKRKTYFRYCNQQDLSM